MEIILTANSMRPKHDIPPGELDGGSCFTATLWDTQRIFLAVNRQLRGRREQKLAFLEMILRYLAAATGQLTEASIRTAPRKALPIEVEKTVMPTIAETREAHEHRRPTVRPSRCLRIVIGQQCTGKRPHGIDVRRRRRKPQIMHCTIPQHLPSRQRRVLLGG